MKPRDESNENDESHDKSSKSRDKNEVTTTSRRRNDETTTSHDENEETVKEIEKLHKQIKQMRKRSTSKQKEGESRFITAVIDGSLVQLDARFAIEIRRIDCLHSAVLLSQKAHDGNFPASCRIALCHQSCLLPSRSEFNDFVCL